MPNHGDQHYNQTLYQSHGPCWINFFLKFSVKTVLSGLGTWHQTPTHSSHNKACPSAMVFQSLVFMQTLAEDIHISNDSYEPVHQRLIFLYIALDCEVFVLRSGCMAQLSCVCSAKVIPSAPISLSSQARWVVSSFFIVWMSSNNEFQQLRCWVFSDYQLGHQAVVKTSTGMLDNTFFLSLY